MDFVKAHNYAANITDNMSLCSQHFNEEYFNSSSPWRKYLLPNAVPTIKINRLKYVSNFPVIVIYVKIL